MKGISSTSNNETVVEDFLHSQRIDRGAADQTIQAYRTDLTQFIQWLPSDLSLQAIQESDIHSYLSYLHKTQQKPSSISRKLSALRQFFRFCCLEKNLEKNPMEQVLNPSLAKSLPKSLSFDQINALLAAADQGIPYPKALGNSLRARDRTMVYLLYATGLRVSELVGLTSHQLDLNGNYLKIKGKGDKERITPFAPVAGQLLQIYLNEFRPQLNPVSDHLFVNHRGFALTRQAFWKVLKTLAIQAGMPSSLSPHTLRHSFATHLLQSGMNLRSLQMLLGHSDLSTTQVYTHITPDHLKEAHQRYHPRGESD
jgi:integrase/recombinase XerD